MPPIHPPLARSRFTLDSSGVAGFFGGEEAISAMATVHLYKGRRWLGWYNSPGSYTIAKRFGRMAKTRFWDGLFPGPNDPPAISFGLDGKKGPQYVAALSGTTMNTGHLAFLAMERSTEIPQEEIEGRQTTPFDVAYLAMHHVDYDTPVERLPFKKALIGLFPIAASIVTCVMCALVYDWFGFTLILFGIISSGLTSLVIGKGTLVIKTVKEPAAGSPPGHGMLKGDGGMMVIKGEERDVNVITKGHFDLEIAPKGKQGGGDKSDGAKGNKDKGDACKYHAIGACSFLLLVQFLLQLLLIPQGKLFGQIMFLTSLGVSWGYNSYLSSLEKERIQEDILFKKLANPKIRRFRTGTRTTMAVFVCLVLFHGVDTSSLRADAEVDDEANAIIACNRALRDKILDHCLLNDTPVWKRWRKRVIDQLVNISDQSESLSYLAEDEGDPELSESENKLFKLLLRDAGAAFRGYFKVRKGLPVDSSHQSEKARGV